MLLCFKLAFALQTYEARAQGTTKTLALFNARDRLLALDHGDENVVEEVADNRDRNLEEVVVAVA